jgi:hypothetical protein
MKYFADMLLALHNASRPTKFRNERNQGGFTRANHAHVFSFRQDVPNFKHALLLHETPNS